MANTTFKRKHPAGICRECGCAIPVGRASLCAACREKNKRLTRSNSRKWKRRKLIRECRACGFKSTKINGDGFCDNCVHRGWDGVFLVTGKRRCHEPSRPILTRVAVTDGWRGQVVIGGGGTPLNKQFF